MTIDIDRRLRAALMISLLMLCASVMNGCDSDGERSSSAEPKYASTTTARAVFDPSDSAFNGALTLSFDSSQMDDGALVLEFASGGVTFHFESLSGVPLDSGNDSLFSFGFGAAGPALVLTVTPPVPALGFIGTEVDGCPGASFAGTSVVEQVYLPPPCTPSTFFGAAEIGDIGSVDASRPSSVWFLEQVVFVPPSSIPDELADLVVFKAESGQPTSFAMNGGSLAYSVDLFNVGPDSANNVHLVDFLPRNVYDTHSSSTGVANYDPATETVTLNLPGLAESASASLLIDGTTPPRGAFSCNAALVNVAIASASAIDPDLFNNIAVTVTRFDDAAVRGLSEICDDGIDNNCDGRVDCADGSQCRCRPTLPPLPGGDPLCFGGFQEGLVDVGLFIPDTCAPQDNPAEEHACTVPRGECPNVTVPPYCCDPYTFSNPAGTLNVVEDCNVGVPGCAPRDPNFKEADPGVNLHGYGYTAAGQTIHYTLHYENVGDVDAHDVMVLDVLDLDLDEASLVLLDGGVYLSSTRTIIWSDPVVPPATPRSVRFSAAVRADAQPGVRVRNVGTVIFPDAVPPTRIDTNFVEHVVPAPDLDLSPYLRVSRCTETAPGSGEWKVHLVNDGAGFAFNVTATIIDPPVPVDVIEGLAIFSHPDDPLSRELLSVIAYATTTSEDTVAFTTETPGDPCAALTWRITWQDIAGVVRTEDVQAKSDRDRDAVPDEIDNCPDIVDPDQSDEDGDGIGDACEVNGTPDCNAAFPSASELWPPNHHFIRVGILGLGGEIAIEVTRVTSDEPVGKKAPDAIVEVGGEVQLRAERDGHGDGRIYVIHFVARAASGIPCQGTVTVVVPHDQDHLPVNTGQQFDATASGP